MNRHVRITQLALVFALFATAPAALHSQSIKDRLKAKTQERTEAAKERTGDRLDAALDKALDDIENAVKCVVGDDEYVAKAKEDGQKVVVTNDEGKILPPEKQPAGSPAKNPDAVGDFYQGHTGHSRRHIHHARGPDILAVHRAGAGCHGQVLVASGSGLQLKIPMVLTWRA